MKRILYNISKTKFFKPLCLILFFIIPYFKGYIAYVKSKNLPNDYISYLKFRLGFSNTYWAKDKTCIVANPKKIFVGICSKIGRPGSYIQGAGKVYIGNYVRFAPNIGILTSNHDLYNRDIYNNAPIKIGDYCWIGMNSIILAGVELGENTIVGAGAVVTKSFHDGHCVIAGNPAKIIKQLDKNLFKPWHYPTENQYYGYIPKDKFEKIKNKYLSKEL